MFVVVCLSTASSGGWKRSDAWETTRIGSEHTEGLGYMARRVDKGSHGRSRGYTGINSWHNT